LYCWGVSSCEIKVDAKLIEQLRADYNELLEQ
jgi:hypothetical protein